MTIGSTMDVDNGPAPDVAAAKPAVGVQVDGSSQTIFDLWTVRQRYVVLLVSAFATLLLPFSDTIYLPALQNIQVEFHTTKALATASISIYMFTVGIACLVWGPLSDKFGRRLTYIVACSVFIAVSIVCIFAPSIGVLVAFRALQGGAVGAFWAIGNGAVADVFPPAQRGTAAGIFMIPVLVGPILGPLVGGGLAQAFGWRSTFVALAILSGVALVGIAFMLPETHQWLLLEKLKKQDPDLSSSIAENSSIVKPTFMMPWGPLHLLLPLDISPHALVALIYFGSMFISLTELPLFLAAKPYNLSEGLIGLCYLPSGIGSFLGSVIGGVSSDAIAAKFPMVLEARLLPGTMLSLVTGIPSLLLYGWSLKYRLRLAVVLVAHFFVGFSAPVYLPCVFSFLTLKKQSQSGAAAAGVQSLMFIVSGVLISVAVVAVEALGAGIVFTIAAGAALVVALIALALQLVCLRAEVISTEAVLCNKGPTQV